MAPGSEFVRNPNTMNISKTPTPSPIARGRLPKDGVGHMPGPICISRGSHRWPKALIWEQAEASPLEWPRRSVPELHANTEPAPETDGSNLGPGFVLLQDVGPVPSHRLSHRSGILSDGHFDLEEGTSVQGCWCQPSASQDGSETLGLRYKFSESLRDQGARHFRISIRRFEGACQPADYPVVHQRDLFWQFYEQAGDLLFVRSERLGPADVGRGLYQIPYQSDRDWLQGQFHVHLDPDDFVGHRNLVTLELFDNRGQRLLPKSSAPFGSADEPTAEFTFRRWNQPVGLTDEVPFDVLTHLIA